MPSWKLALSEGTFISHLEKDADIKFWFKHYFNFIPRELHVALRVPNILAVKHAVLQNMGMGMMSLRLVAEELESGRLKSLVGKKKPYQNEMAVVVPTTKHENLVVTKFAEFLRDEI